MRGEPKLNAVVPIGPDGTYDGAVAETDPESPATQPLPPPSAFKPSFGWQATQESVDGIKMVAKASSSKSVKINVPGCFSKGRTREVVVSLAMMRSNRFGLLSAAVLSGGLVWAGIRFYLMIDGENQVSEVAFRKLSQSIAYTIRQHVEQNLVYQDMVANVWTMHPQITRDEFRHLVMSEAFAPGLEVMTGISLTPRVVGSAARQTLENAASSEALRQLCCANDPSTGTSCATVAATGLFCNEEAGARYQITQFGASGLVPAVANTADYLERVGAEEYMVVDMIEPFAANAKVWGFNLLSSEARNQAWKSAKATGQKTVTRRLNLVQSSVKEFGFLVWLPVFANEQGDWTTAWDGNVAKLTPMGSVNGVYRAQQLLTAAIESTYSKEQLSDLSIFLFDNAEELNGEAQYLGLWSQKIKPDFEHFQYASISEVTKDKEYAWIFENIPIKIRSSDARWNVIVAASDTYLSDRRTNNAWYGLVVSVTMLIAGAVERWLGHPALLLQKAAEVC